jgi:cyanate lyase
MNRQSLAEKIMALKHAKRISWEELAEAIRRSPGFAHRGPFGSDVAEQRRSAEDRASFGPQRR